MKATYVELPEELKKKCKMKAVELGLTFKDFLIEAMMDKLEKEKGIENG